MPNKNKEEEVERDVDALQNDQPDPAGPEGSEREAITHPDANPPGNPDSTYRPGDPPAGQSMFPPTPRSGSVASAAVAEEKNEDAKGQ